MRVSTYLQIAMAVAASASPVVVAAAVPRDVSSSCNKEAIDSCVASTAQTGSTCFVQLCAGAAADGVAKRQSDCTEENLFQCAILDWNEAQACFQQLCL